MTARTQVAGGTLSARDDQILGDQPRTTGEAVSVRSRARAVLKTAALAVPPIRRVQQQRDELALALDREQARSARLNDALATERAHQLDVVGSVRVGFPLGHFYSPIPNLDEVRERAEHIFAARRNVPGVHIDAERQLGRLDEFSAYYTDLPYADEGPTAGLRYRFDNNFFSYGDGIAYYCMLRSIRPRRIIEIGSGWSSALALDIDDMFLGGQTEMTFIEPYPERLRALLDERDATRVQILPEPLHRVDDAIFDSLDEGDLLFVDSTHVSKIGSDVNQIILEILPALKPRVHVHVHDIFYPFEYPAEWVFAGRAWNENYLLRAFLVDNSRVKINWFNSHLAQFHVNQVAARLPLWGRNPGGSVWLEIC
jgi:hypothetical protein